MVTGDATTAVVTHAERVGSRLEACLWGAPPAPDASGNRAEGGRREGTGTTSSRRWPTTAASLQPGASSTVSAAAPQGCGDGGWGDRAWGRRARRAGYAAGAAVWGVSRRPLRLGRVAAAGAACHRGDGVDRGLLDGAVLEECGFAVKLVEVQQVRQVPGRKTDVQDGQGRQALHPSGILRGAVRPEDEVGVWCSSLRQRRRRVAMASRAVHPMQPALAQRPLKLTAVVSESPGKPGMTIIRAILAGDRAPQRWAPSRDKRGPHDHATIAQALTGPWRAEQLVAWQQAVDQDDCLVQQWRACDGHSEGCRPALVPDGETDAPPAPPARPWRSSRSNPLSCEGQAALEAMTGVALPPSDGIARRRALQVLSAMGLARTRWPTRQHCAAWLG